MGPFVALGKMFKILQFHPLIGLETKLKKDFTPYFSVQRSMMLNVVLICYYQSGNEYVMKNK